MRSTAPEPRRRPDSSEGRAIFESILTACGLLLERDGMEGLNTNAVARVAGVSVGSLYQYFANKEAIVVELARWQQARGSAFALEHGPLFMGAGVREALFRGAALAASQTFGSGAMRSALLHEVPRAWILEPTQQLDTVVESMAAALFASRPEELRPGVGPAQAATAYRALKGVVEGAVLFEPNLVGTRALHQELFQLLFRYVALDGASLEAPDLEWDPAWPKEAAPDAPLLERLRERPSTRRAVEVSPAVSARGRATRAKILAAAGRRLVTLGTEGTTARGIAREAGISAGGLYRHFKNVPSVFAAMQIEHEAQLRLALTEGVLQGDRDSGRDAAAAIVRTTVSVDPELWALASAQVALLPRRWAHDARRGAPHPARSRLGELLSRRTDVRSASPQLLAFVAVRAVEGVLETRMLEGGPPPDEMLLNELTDLVWRYVRA